MSPGAEKNAQKSFTINSIKHPQPLARHCSWQEASDGLDTEGLQVTQVESAKQGTSSGRAVLIPSLGWLSS